MSASRPRAAASTAWLAGAAIGAAACGLLGGDGSDETGEAAPPPAKVATSPHGTGSDPEAAHARASASGIRCSKCHEEASRQDPVWRERAMAIGHDVSVHVAEASDCSCCHLGEIRGFAAPTNERCGECHEDVHVSIPKMAETHCLACHDLTPGHDLREAAWECQRCHAEGEHGAIAVDVHAGEPCESCHQPHDEPWVLAQGCGDCHGGADRVKHGAGDREQALVCEDCHEPHEVAGEAPARCIPCHQKEEPGRFDATVFPGHDACTSCHAPHAFAEEEAPDCASCHAENVVTSGPAEHARCSSCHETHAPRGAAQACVGCHEGVKVSHGDAAREGCTTCHDPHGGSKGHPQKTATCGSCHDDAQHPGKPHGGKLACNGCHAPHTFEGEAAPACATCHAGEAKAAAAHTACSSCHGDVHAVHDGGGACGTCHADVTGSMTRGHGACGQCHDAHSGSLEPQAARCESCHAPKARGPHAAVPNGCESCHRAHGPTGVAAPAPCASCHAPATSKGLHALPAHQDCRSCHTAHAPPSATRDTCLTCHTAQKDHQPEARVCNGCHAFADGYP